MNRRRRTWTLLVIALVIDLVKKDDAAGTWQDSRGQRLTGPATVTASAALDELPIFERK